MRSRKRKPFLKTKKAAVLGLLAVGLLSFGTTWAYYSAQDSLANPLRTSSSGAAMVEEFDPTSSFLPGETVAKVVAFQNTGDMDLLLRVKVAPDEAWMTTGTDAAETDDLDTRYVLKTWSEEWGPLTIPTSEKDVDDLEGKSEYEVDIYDLDNNGGSLDTTEWTAPYAVLDDEGNHVLDEEGNPVYYRYYKWILRKKGDDEGNDITDPILKNIKLSEAVSNDRHATDYSDKIYKLTFDAEAIPVEDGTVQTGAKSEWDMIATVDDDAGTVIWNED